VLLEAVEDGEVRELVEGLAEVRLGDEEVDVPGGERGDVGVEVGLERVEEERRERAVGRDDEDQDGR
jgi:hypothetical protein